MNRDIGRDAFLVRRADDLDDPARGLLDMGRVIEDLGNDHLAVLRATGLALGDQHPVRDLRIVRYDESDAAFLDELPGDFARRAFQHLDELAFRLAAPILADDPDDDPVAVEQ